MPHVKLAFRTVAVLTLLGVQSATGETIVSIVPVGTSAGGELAAGAVITGNTITLSTDGVNPVPVFLEFRIGDWDPADTGVRLAAYQLVFDSSSLTTGVSGELTFNVGSTPCGECSDNGEPCIGEEDCTLGWCSIWGAPCHNAPRDCPSNSTCIRGAVCDATVSTSPTCSDTGNPCATAEDCTPGTCYQSGVPCRGTEDLHDCPDSGDGCFGAASCDGGGVCETALGAAFRCGYQGYFLGSGTCSFVGIDAQRSDYVFSGLHTALPLLDLATANVRVAGVVILDASHDPEPFPVEGLYAGTMALLIPPDALGTFTISMLPSPSTALSEVQPDQSLPFSLTPARITVNPDGLRDCNGNSIYDWLDVLNGSSLDCSGNGVPDECEPDCNANGTADSCDIASGTSLDRLPWPGGNGIPDECQPPRFPKPRQE